MDNLKLAHEMALAIQGIKLLHDMELVSEMAWKYADAMQAEAEKRVNKDRPEVLLTKDKDGNCLHFHHEFGHKKCMDCGESLEERQPDWSQAPEWAIAWTMDSGETLWWSHKPELKNGYWFVEDSVAWQCAEAPTFGFTGSHIVERPDSLRKRPQQEELLYYEAGRNYPPDAYVIYNGKKTLAASIGGKK